MSFDYHELQRCLSSWPSIQIPTIKADDSVFDRIRQILALMARGEKLQKADFQPLIRHILIHESLRKRQPIVGDDDVVESSDVSNAALRVPFGEAWPSPDEWESHGVKTMMIGTDSLFLTARPWDPIWIRGREHGVFTDAFSDKYVREDGRCLADPFISDVTAYSHYSSPGQREAVRAAFLIPPGETLIVNLPTGSGKSLVGQVPSLVYPQDGNLTLFVVPTVALAIDQAGKMTEYFQKSKKSNQKWPLAWHSDTKKEDKSEIRRRLQDGTQRILFVSPETLTTSLLRTVFDVARNGMLSYLVIDEAHLVTQWGAAFRPAFQVLAGLRNSLLEMLKKENLVAFRTLLLSATFTPETTETLANLFGPRDCVQMVAAVHLRPEPQYWFSCAGSFHERVDQVLEALRHAPRPFILYVTEPSEALRWKTILEHQAGYRRVDRFDGDTQGSKRDTIISAWNRNELDGIVATSAFGVGIDKADVRTIIHATIPETLDRFYQEVGRGGRDGKNSVSLVVYENQDWSSSKRMANPKLISDELGYERWEALYKSRKKYGDHDGIFPIDIRAIRAGRKNSNDEDVRWNMRTLMLMSRAGLIEILVDPSNVLEEDGVEKSLSPFASMTSFRIRLLDDNHSSRKAWETKISESRQLTYTSGKQNLELMKGILQGGREVAKTLAELYRNNSNKWSVEVAKVCGGCPSDRFVRMQNNLYKVPIPTSIHKIFNSKLNRWDSIFPHLNKEYVPVFYSPETSLESVLRLIKWVVKECGVLEVCADDSSAIIKHNDWHNLYKNSPNGFVIHRNLNQLDQEPYTPLARVTFFDSLVTKQEIEKALLLQRPMHIVLYPTTVPDPTNATRLYSDAVMNSISLTQLNSVINQ